MSAVRHFGNPEEAEAKEMQTHNEARTMSTIGMAVRSENMASRVRLMTLLAMLCVAGQLFFTATIWLLPLASEYTVLGDNISELAIGSFGYFQTTAFVIGGIGALALAVGIKRATRGSWGSRTGPVLIGLFGLGPILAAIFPTDRIDSLADLQSLTTVGIVHIVVSLVSLWGGTAGMFVLSRTFKLDPRWRSLRPASLTLAFVALTLLFLQGEGSLVGFFQRLLSGTIAAWLVLVALRLRSLSAADA